MATTYSANYSRLPGTNVRSFLLRCTNGPLAGVEARELHLVCDDYEHARHRFEPFGQEQLAQFRARLEVLRSVLTANRSVKPHPSPMPMPAASASGGMRGADKSKAYRRAMKIGGDRRAAAAVAPPTSATVDQFAISGGGARGAAKTSVDSSASTADSRPSAV
jgi:hypothetical protein